MVRKQEDIAFIHTLRINMDYENEAVLENVSVAGEVIITTKHQLVMVWCLPLKQAQLLKLGVFNHTFIFWDTKRVLKNYHIITFPSLVTTLWSAPEFRLKRKKLKITSKGGGWGKIIPEVAHTRFPKYVKVFLFYSISYPIKMHARCIGLFLFHFVVHYAVASWFFHLNCCGRLWMYHFL